MAKIMLHGVMNKKERRKDVIWVIKLHRENIYFTGKDLTSDIFSAKVFWTMSKGKEIVEKLAKSGKYAQEKFVVSKWSQREKRLEGCKA